MSNKKFLDSSGLAYFWDKAKEYIEDNTIPKVNDASGNLAQIDSSGNVVDSGVSKSSFALSTQGIPSGGSQNQVLAKTGSENYNVSWKTPSYSDLDSSSKPKINGVSLDGNKDSSTLGLASKEQGDKADTALQPTGVKTINNQSIVGSGNIDTVNGYINANSVSDLNTNYPAGSIYSSKIALIPSQTTSGSLDYYTCVEGNNNTWSWTLAGTTSPTISIQETDTYQPLIPIKSIPCWVKKTDGSFSSTSSVLVYVYDIKGHESIICDYSVIYGGNCCVAFYDEGFDPDDYENTYAASYLGWRYDRYLYGFSENTPVYNQLIYVNDDTTYGTGDITNAKYAVVTTLVSSNLHACRALTPVPQSLVKKTATPNVIIEFLTTIQKPFVTTMDSATNQEITETNTLSPWAVVFPTSYANIGRPTPVVAMLHGLGGFVTSQVMGYSGTGWVNTRQAYLDAGFAVMDINGTGISTESDANSKHWGNPCAIETLDKAFEYLKENYNVWDRLLIAGISMGAILAMGYAKCFPGKVAAVGCFAPNLFAYSMRYIGADSTSLKESAWQYQNHAAADADNYKNLTGYVVLNECKVIDENGFLKEFEWPASMPSDWPANLADVKLVDSFPVPMRVWQGTADTEVNPNCSKLLVHSLRRGNSNATLRLCQDAGHDVQNVQYVRNEAVSWFKRFVNN